MQCLQTDTVTNNSNSSGSGNKEEELVLDDYGDLSILLPLLQQQSDTADANSTNSNNDNKEEETKEELILLNGHITPRSPLPQQILDASNYTIRIVLEKYTISSIKDHVVKIRSMLIDGGLPFVSSLVADVDKSGEKKSEDVENGEKVVEEAKVNGEKSGDKSKVRGLTILICAVSIYSSLHTLSHILHISIYALYTQNTHRTTTKSQPRKNNKNSNVSNKLKLPNNCLNINQIMIYSIHLFYKW